MKKSFICVLLAVVMIFSAAQGMICGIAESIPEKETPVAKIENDNYVPYNYENRNNDGDIINSLNSEIESMGGYVEKYSSEEEYQRAQKSASSSAADYSLVESQIESVKQTFTVMTTPTGSKEHGNYVASKPVANAIVRLDGVPRYTDRNGQIKVTLNREYVELYVEKEGYNPYIEIIEPTGEEKVINLKKPSDDIDIYGAILSYDGESINLISQPYSIDMVEEPYISEFSLEILSNVDIDECRILQNGKEVLKSYSGSFSGLNFANNFSVGKNIVVEVTSQGITKTENLLLSILKIEEINLGSLFNDTEKSRAAKTESNDVNIETNDEIIGNFKIDFLNQLKDSLNITKTLKEFSQNKKGNNTGNWEGSSGFHFNFEILHDNKEQTTKIVIGVDFKGAKSKQKEQEIYDAFKKSYDSLSKSSGSRITALAKTVNEAFTNPKFLTDPCNIKSNSGIDIEFGITVVGYVEISDEQFTSGDFLYGLQDKYVKNIGIEVTGDFEFEWIKNSVAVVMGVPIPYYIKLGFGIGLGFNFSWQFTEGVEFMVEFMFEIFGKAGIGIGVGQICGINVYGKLKFEITLCITDKPVSQEYILSLTIGLEGKILCFSFDIPIVKFAGVFNNGRYKETKLAKSLEYKTAKSFSSVEENLGSEPQLVSLGNKKVKVWLEDNPLLDIYNAQTLYYSVYENGTWSKKTPVLDNGYSDYSPSLCNVDGHVYVAWTKGNAIYNGETTLGEVLASQEIYVSEFNAETGQFDSSTRLTNDQMLDGEPRFVKTNDGSTAIIWQSNTENDVFGLSGSNQLCYSKLVSGQWEASRIVVSIDKPILDFDASVQEGQLIVSYILDEDADITTSEDRNLYLKNGSNIAKLSDISVSNPRFAYIDNRLELLYLQNNEIIALTDLKLLTKQKCFDFNSLTDNFEVYSLNNSTFISFIGSTMEGRQTLNVSMYNSVKNEWSDSFEISSSYDIADYSLVVTERGIFYVASNAVRNNDGKTLYTTIIEDEYEFTYGVSLDEIIIMDSLKVGTNCAYITVTNNGSYSFDEICVEVLNEVQFISLETYLKPTESILIPVSFNVSIEDIHAVDIAFTISLKHSESDLSDNSYKLKIDYCDIEMHITEMIFNDKQLFNLTLSNQGVLSENVRVVIRKESQVGEIIFTSELIAINGENEKTQYKIQLDYEALNILPNEILCFQLQCDKEQFIEQSCSARALGYKNEKANYILAMELISNLNFSKNILS